MPKSRKEIFRQSAKEFVDKNFDEYTIMAKQSIIEDIVEIYERYVPETKPPDEDQVKKMFEFIGKNGSAL